MQTSDSNDSTNILSAEAWAQLGSYIDKLPNPVKLVVWGDNHSCQLEDTAALCRAFADRFPILSYEQRDAIPGNPYHPVIGFIGLDAADDSEHDYQIRILGHPGYVQINSMVGAIQAAAFRGMTTEAVTRIHLRQLEASGQPVEIDLFTSPEDEGGVIMATLLSNLTVLSPNMRLRITMINDFPNLISQYSVYNLPHVVINNRHHLQGVYDEDKFLALLARALNPKE